MVKTLIQKNVRETMRVLDDPTNWGAYFPNIFLYVLNSYLKVSIFGVCVP